MDDLLREFLAETGESLDAVDNQLVRFEQEPNNIKILENIFRLVHTIKGTCGFVGLPRLEALTHAAEALMASFRSGAPVTRDAVSLVLATLDRIKALLHALERKGAEPHGDDKELIVRLEQMSAAHERSTAMRQKDGSAPAAGRRVAPPHIAGGDTIARSALESAPSRASEAQPCAAVSGASSETRAGFDAAPKVDEEREDTRSAGGSVRVHVDTLDQLMTMVSELVLTRNQLMEIVRRHQDSEFKTPLQRLSNVTAELQESVLKTRMQPVGNAWKKLPRIVRDLSAELGKPIELEMRGAETELDRQVLEVIRDPLTHMVRNAADHGIEAPQERLAAGKPERGRIRLSARHEGGHILVEISDDGRGLDFARIAARAISLGLVAEHEIAKLTETQIQRFIFAPGFSTAERVTNVSGRGIGMDVVRANVDSIGGSIDVSSVRGGGAVFTIKIPLTLAIARALIVGVAQDRFAIPQAAVLELVRLRNLSGPSIERIRDSALLPLRNKLLPVIDLRSLLDLSARAETATGAGFVVVMQVGMQTFGLMVDRVFDTEEIVVKPMSSALRQIPLFSGSTIMGDGSVILILDPNRIADEIGISKRAAVESERELPMQDEARLDAMLLFRAGSPGPKAVPLSLVTRLEEIDAGTIERSNGRAIVQYRGRLMPLVPAAEEVKLKTSGAQPVLVLSDDRHSIGLAVDEIIDIVEERLELQLASECPGLLGSAVIKGRATEVIDLSHFLSLAFDGYSWNAGAGVNAKRSALLVDDAPFFRNMLAPLLEAAGYAVTAVASASEGLAAAQSGQCFDVIITDIEMPGMDGFDLASMLRQHPRTAHTPIIGLSSSISPDGFERGKQLGMRGYLGKFDRPGLIAALKSETASPSRAATG
ncbi:MAG TPA: chemotaxis protein CheW [Xanthobacteraceae bacterium]|jgi:two-component system chemotaxis sensor kinase CheA